MLHSVTLWWGNAVLYYDLSCYAILHYVTSCHCRGKAVLHQNMSCYVMLSNIMLW